MAANTLPPLLAGLLLVAAAAAGLVAVRALGLVAHAFVAAPDLDDADVVVDDDDVGFFLLACFARATQAARLACKRAAKRASSSNHPREEFYRLIASAVLTNKRKTKIQRECDKNLKTLL